MTATAPGYRHLICTALSLGEWAVTAEPDALLTCVGLGSCVAVTMHDPVAKVGGMAHMVLPDSTAARSAAVGAKFVDIGIPLVLEALLAQGAQRRRLRVCLAGGAQMLQSALAPGGVHIGQRNAEAAREQLKALGLGVGGERLGGTRGRTVRLVVATGRVTAAESGDQEVEL